MILPCKSARSANLKEVMKRGLNIERILNGGEALSLSGEELYITKSFSKSVRFISDLGQCRIEYVSELSSEFRVGERGDA